MNVREFSRAAVLIACGFVLGCLFSQSIIDYRDGRQPIQPSIKPAEIRIPSQSPNHQKNNSNNLENSYKKEFLEFSKINTQMSKLNASYSFAKKYVSERDENNDVPKILHFLWVFQPIPEKYLEAISAFEKNNPNYEIFLWTDNSSIPKVQNKSSWEIRHVDTLNLTIPEVIDGESSEKKAGWGWIGAYTDLLSYEIIHQFGGIYLDTDSQSLKPFDSLFQHSFVCYDAGWNTLVHSVFGMPPKSKFLRFALESARLNFQHEEFRKRIVYLRYGPTFLGKMFFEFHDSTINIIDSRYLIWNQNNNENYMIQTNDQSWGGKR